MKKETEIGKKVWKRRECYRENREYVRCDRRLLDGMVLQVARSVGVSGYVDSTSRSATSYIVMTSDPAWHGVTMRMWVTYGMCCTNFWTRSESREWTNCESETRSNTSVHSACISGTILVHKQMCVNALYKVYNNIEIVEKRDNSVIICISVFTHSCNFIVRNAIKFYTAAIMSGLISYRRR